MGPNAVGLCQKKEEGTVLDNGAGNIASKLILNQNIARVHFLA